MATTDTFKLKTVHIRRLHKLIAFLDKLPSKRFNFAIVRNEPPKCGAVGCAIGYMPNVFPRVFQSVPCSEYMWWGTGQRWTHNIDFRGCNTGDFMGATAWLTGLDEDTARNLFEPDSQSYVNHLLKDLPESATPKQVARMLEKFIELHK